MCLCGLSSNPSSVQQSVLRREIEKEQLLLSQMSLIADLKRVSRFVRMWGNLAMIWIQWFVLFLNRSSLCTYSCPLSVYP